MTWIPFPKIDIFSYFYDLSPLVRDTIFKESYLTALKKHIDVSN